MLPLTLLSRTIGAETVLRLSLACCLACLSLSEKKFLVQASGGTRSLTSRSLKYSVTNGETKRRGGPQMLKEDGLDVSTRVTR